MLDPRGRSRQRSLQRLLGDLGRVMPFERRPTCDLPAPGWYAYLSPSAAEAAVELRIGWPAGGLHYLAGDSSHAAAAILLIVRELGG